MNIEPSAMVHAVLEMRAAGDAQAVQVEVLKRAMSVQEQAAMRLLMALPGSLPLAPAGQPGAQVNVMV
jgi:hypothetical protein